MVATITDRDSGVFETPDDAGTGGQGIVKRWNTEWDLASKSEDGWRKRVRKALDRYRDDTDKDSGREDTPRRLKFNILYSNVQTLAPCLYNSTPNPDVRRRFRDADPLGKQVADILERALSYSNDAEDIDAVMQAAVWDYLLPGRAVTRVRYMPTFHSVNPADNDEEAAGTNSERQGPDVLGEPTQESQEAYENQNLADPGQGSDADQPDDDEPYDALAWEECICEPVQWDMFRRGPGKRWNEVPWIGFEHHLTRQEARDKFSAYCPDIDKIDLDFVPENVDGEVADKDPDTFKRMTVREIWDRDKREVLFIAPKYTEAPLKIEKDPLQLEGFFPVPRPLYAIETTDTLIPVEEFRMYEGQQKELDRITHRINRIINGLKLRGVYDSTIVEMENLFRSDDNAMLPAQNIVPLVQQGGALANHIWMLPIRDAAAVLVELYNQRDRIIQAVYELTGIGDVMRAQSDPRETATAQATKSRWGSMRLQRRQREVQRYARDLMRIKAEIIAKHFNPSTLMLMTGVQMLTEEEKHSQMAALMAQGQQIQDQRAQAAAAQAAQAQMGQPPMPAGQSPPQNAAPPPMMGHNGGPPMAPAA